MLSIFIDIQMNALDDLALNWPRKRDVIMVTSWFQGGVQMD